MRALLDTPNLGKLQLNKPFKDLFPDQLIAASVGLLPIQIKHLATLTELDRHHRDPFDRMIIAQALSVTASSSVNASIGSP